MTDRSAVSPGATESYRDYVARLRSDLAALQSERASPGPQQRLEVIEHWISVIELELKQLGEAPF